MTIREVRLFGDPVLRSRADQITTFDSALRTLSEDMLETMEEHHGVGLAANQVGILQRIFVYDCSHETEGARGVVINPQWEALDEDTELGNEGCLSIPGVHKDVERASRIRCTGQDLEGKEISFEATGLLARCVQHETDHLDGVLFLSRLSPALRKEAMAEIRASEWF